jgi:hypothetical protein
MFDYKLPDVELPSPEEVRRLQEGEDRRREDGNEER